MIGFRFHPKDMWDLAGWLKFGKNLKYHDCWQTGVDGGRGSVCVRTTVGIAADKPKGIQAAGCYIVSW